MDLVRLNKDLKNKNRIYQKGLVFLAIKTDHGQYLACDRNCGFAGEVFHAEHCEIVPEWQGLDQELIKLREEVAALTEERSLLLQQIERTIEEQPKPVALPLKVAEAINNCRAVGMSGIVILTNMEHIGQLFRDYGPQVRESLSVIREFTQQVIGGGQVLLEALVNGYTVEQPAEVKLINGLLKVIERWFSIPSHESNPGEDERELAQMIAEYVKGIYADQTA